MTNRVRSIRRAFLVSASFPAAALLGVSAASAQQTVSVAEPATTAAVNTRIGTAIATPSRDLKVDITAAGVVTGGGAITVQPAENRGDGTVSFVNSGRIGALDADGSVITDFVGVSLRGSGLKADNNVSATNSGLITGGVQIGTLGSVGGTASFTNAAGGQVLNGVTVVSNGDVKIDTAAGSAVTSGSVVGNAARTITLDTKDNVSTEVVRGGSATINIAGNVQSKDGTVAGAVTGSSASATTINVSGSVGAVSATALDARTSTFLAAVPAPVASKTSTTRNDTTTWGNGTANVSITGKAASVFANARTTAAVVVDGTVVGGVTANVPNATNSSVVNTETRNADSAVVATTFESSSKAAGADATVAIGQGGTVGTLTVPGNVNANGIKSASITNAGTVNGNLIAQTTGAPNDVTSTQRNTLDGKGTITSQATTFVSTPVGGAATIAVAAGGVVGGQKDGVTVAGGNVAAFAAAGKASVTNAGAIRGSVTVSSSGTSFDQARNFKSEAIATPASTRTTNSVITTRAATGSTASLNNSATGNIAGNINVSGDAGASLSNAGIIGRTNTGQTTTLLSQRQLEVLNQSETISTVAADNLSSSSSNATKITSRTVGGPVSFENLSTGVVSGNISLTGAGDIAITNAGAVRGQTFASTFGRTTETVSESSTSSVTTPAKAPALASTATTSKSSSSTTETSTGGSIVGLYSGSNGSLNFNPVVDGSITQNAGKDSSVTVSGAVFGSVNSNAGLGSAASFGSTSAASSIIDSAGTGTRAATNSDQFKFAQTAGASTVVISGTVGDSAVSSAGVGSTGNSKASVAISGRIEGNVGVNSNGVFASSGSTQRTIDQLDTKFVTRTLSVSETSQNAQANTAGVASADLSGKATVLGNVSVAGNTQATAVVASTAAIGSATVTGNLSVNAGQGIQDARSDTKSQYAFDQKTKLGSSTTTTTSLTSPSAPAAIATAQVDGKVFGTTSVGAVGSATAVVTGVSSNGVNVFAGGTTNERVVTDTGAGISTAAAGTTFAAASSGLTRVSSTSVETNTNVLGKASVNIATSADLQTAGVAATTGGSISASGGGGASVTIGQGSIVNSTVSANAIRTNSATNRAETFTFDPNFVEANGQPLTIESKQANTAVGGVASVANAGTVNSSLTASGLTGAAVENSGKAVSASAFARATNSTTTVSGTNLNNAALQRQIETTTFSTVGGAATVNNKAGAILGSANVGGVTGSVVNNGIINGTTNIGIGLFDYTTVTTRTPTSTLVEVTQPATRPTQTYTVDQNFVSRDISVGGATVSTGTLADGVARTLTTSNVVAAINLNKGSVTLGSITAQVDAKTGARLTNTTVNLNDSGFLGADTIVFGNVPANQLEGTSTPLARLPEKVAPLLGFADNSVSGGIATRVLGVTTLNKTGAGTFVINGAAYTAPTVPGTKAVWTVEAATLNNKAGELQLTVPGDFATIRPEFGILGNVNNDATLVLGRRDPAAVAAVGDSLINSGPETIDGIIVRQQGNFVQSATGSLVVGLTPSLARFGGVFIPTAGNAAEPLGPVAAGVNVPFFTTAARLGRVGETSGLNITGDLNLAGTVRLNVTRDSLFTNGDGYTLITYTGTGAVTATAVPSLTSRFVSFGLVHDTAAKTVALRATRASYATGATDPNSVAAATALDTALTAAVTAIRTDASGGAGFQTVSQIGFAQDVANVATGLDYRLSAEQSAQVFRELSSGEIYGSLSSLNQNVAFGETMNMLAIRRAQGGELSTSIWGAPIGNFAKFGGLQSGASRLETTSYGASFGIDLAYSANGVIGFGGAYAEHDLNAQRTTEQADATTWTIGTYVHQRFNQIYVNALFAYGFTRFDVERELALLSRTMNSSFRGKQLDASLEVGYDFTFGQAQVTPYGKLAIRRVSMNGFTEENGGGFGLVVDDYSNSMFSPTLGLRVGGQFEPNDNIKIRPFIRGSFTFQGDVEAARNVAYRAGGNQFALVGVQPGDFGSIDLGIDTELGDGLNLFVNGGYSFGGGNEVTSVRGGVNFRF